MCALASGTSMKILLDYVTTYVNFKEEKKGYVLDNKDFADIFMYVEQSGLMDISYLHSLLLYKELFLI